MVTWESKKTKSDYPTMNKLLVVDTETSGLLPGVHSLLSIGLVVWNGQIEESEEILVQCNGEIDPRAMEINRINLEEHEKVALPYFEAKTKFLGFLRKNFNDTEKITIAGHNVNFDVSFLKVWFDCIGSDNKFSDIFNHRVLDTNSIGHFLYLANVMEKDSVKSLDALLKEFDVKIDEDKRHTALGDALGTAMLLSEMVGWMDTRLNYHGSSDWFND